MPNSAGRVEKSLCYKDLTTIVEQACRLQKPDAGSNESSHTTLLVRNMQEFCPKFSQECRIILFDFVNSWYATDIEDVQRDTFAVSMFYFNDDGTRVVIYEGIDGSVYARP